MNTNEIIGREHELNLLDKCYASGEAEFVIIYGRRRVGKTFLVRKHFEGKFDFVLTGIYNKPKAIQLANFASALEEYSGESQPIPETWFEAFNQLKRHLASLNKERLLVFIDEMPWLDTKKSNFLAAFELFWNGWGAAQDRLMLVVCGSATTWITDKIFADKGGLFNRATRRIYLKQFTLNETERYLISRKIRWNRKTIAECYMTMGGIPFYLRQLSPELSFPENIDQIFFKRRGALWDEYDHLFATLFHSPEPYIQIVEALSKKRKGLTRNELVETTKITDSGSLTKLLKDLCGSDFIQAYSYFGSNKKNTLYRLSDFYTLFYNRFVKEHYGKDENYWTHTLTSPAHNTWAGLAFETLCLQHVTQIKRQLGISGILSEDSSWFAKGSNGERGAQIDLVIDRSDNVINLCEMKFAKDEYEISKEDEEDLRHKANAFQTQTKTRKALHLTMVTTYGVKRGMYSDAIQSQVLLDHLFSPE